MSMLAIRRTEILALIRDHGPISPNRLTEISGVVRQAVDKYIRQCHDAELIHVESYGPSPVIEGRTVKLWAFGRGEDAHRQLKQRKTVAYMRKRTRKSKEQQIARAERARRISEEANRLPARDPITAAWFGKPTRDYATADLSRRVYRQEMNVDDEVMA